MMNIQAYGAISALLAAWFRFGLGLTAATRLVGMVLADTNTGTGYQDAITPPISTKLNFVCWACILGFFYYTYSQLGGTNLLVTIAIFVCSTIAAGVFVVPGPSSPFWIRIIFRSLASRAADYEGKGQHMRAAAALDLLNMLTARMGNRL